MKLLVVYGALIAGVIVFAYPFLWMAAGSLKPELEISSLDLVPSEPTLRGYEHVLGKIPIGRAFVNSLLVSCATTASVVLFGSLVGYALARLRFAGRSLLFLVILFTTMIPFQIVIIPQYVLIVKLGLTDTYLGLVLPTMMTAFSIILFRQFFMNIPQSLIDAARIDGCSELGIMFRVIWPVSKPILATVSIITFMTSWNEVLWPLMVVRERMLMTMPQIVTIFTIGGEAESQLGSLLAAATLLALPVVVVYAIFQRYFIESMASAGVKG